MVEPDPETSAVAVLRVWRTPERTVVRILTVDQPAATAADPVEFSTDAVDTALEYLRDFLERDAAVTRPTQHSRPDTTTERAPDSV
ncbi:MAG: hypothetical protein AAGA37_13685 [Actinomycetota bacterium]